MSTRFDAASDRISFSGTMFAVGSGLTITAWAYVSVDTDTFATIGRLHASSGASTIVTWATGGDGLSGPNYFTGGGTVTNATNFAVGSWRKVALTCSGTTGKLYIATVGGATEADSGTVSVGTPDGLTLGGRAPADSSEPWNGRLAYVRIWTTELSQAQIEAEWASTTPVVTSGLWADWPLTDSTDLTDHSGNGRNLSAGSTAVSTEADPPLGVSGTGSAAFGALTATATGTRSVFGVAAASFGALTATATGTRTVSGAASFNGGALSGSSSGTRTVVATATAAFGGLTGSALVTSSITGTATGGFGGLNGTATGGVPAAAQGGGSGWWGLVSIYAEATEYVRREKREPPTACPHDGEPLLRAPDGTSLFCPWGNYQYPRDRRII